MQVEFGDEIFYFEFVSYLNLTVLAAQETSSTPTQSIPNERFRHLLLQDRARLPERQQTSPGSPAADFS